MVIPLCVFQCRSSKPKTLPTGEFNGSCAALMSANLEALCF
ncbi:hypothetical protein swp_0715 [Shewanella piezotolerans WP3]|uniref:Uncharacterized protein n=1 Tax=Shewanella piezotolerans (strain WP3 / JCM 13877) TaxID=225849 RepID=B8CIQ5_SHEPW|nr:hypothetical protein swp_0715 [Shewanella piezotolerans WP3]